MELGRAELLPDCSSDEQFEDLPCPGCKQQLKFVSCDNLELIPAFPSHVTIFNCRDAEEGDEVPGHVWIWVGGPGTAFIHQPERNN